MTHDDGTRPQAPAPAPPPARVAPRKIQHSAPGISSPPATTSDELEPLPVVESLGPKPAMPRITPFGKENRTESPWQRKPNTTGTGAVHVKTFHSKLTDDALMYLDQTINEWLDAHPEFEVKFVTSTVGEVTGKLREPHLICQVWV